MGLNIFRRYKNFSTGSNISRALGHAFLSWSKTNTDPMFEGILYSSDIQLIENFTNRYGQEYGLIVKASKDRRGKDLMKYKFNTEPQEVMFILKWA